MLNPIPTRLCHVIYYHTDKKYPCLVGLGLIEENMDLSCIHLAVLEISIYQRKKKPEIQMRFQENLNPLWCGFRICRLQQFLFIESVPTVFIGLLCPFFQSGVLLIDLKSPILFHQVNRLDSSDVNRIFLQKVWNYSQKRNYIHTNLTCKMIFSFSLRKFVLTI